MTDARHDGFAELAAAYALGALDAVERADFEVHLRTCDVCQKDAASYGAVAAGVGVSVEPVTPPPALKARVLATATTNARGRTFEAPALRVTPPAPRPASTFPWLALAASLVLAAGAGAYSWILHQQLKTSRRVVTEISARAETMRAQLSTARGDAARSARVLRLLTAPDVVHVSLAGTKDASGAKGQVYWSPSRGMWFTVDGLPVPSPGRIYQLWLILPRRAAPLSAGLLAVDSQGTGTLITAGPSAPGVTTDAGATLAITNEPSAGSPGPTTPVLLAGTAKPE